MFQFVQATADGSSSGDAPLCWKSVMGFEGISCLNFAKAGRCIVEKAAHRLCQVCRENVLIPPTHVQGFSAAPGLSALLNSRRALSPGTGLSQTALSEWTYTLLSERI